MNRKMRERGFTLIEVMIVVVVIGILAAIALPAYTDSMQKTRRADAKATLTDVAQRLERCYTMFSAYNNASCSPAPGDFPFNSPEGYYQIQATALIANAFTLSAVPQGAQASDTRCATMTLTNTGVRGVSGTAGVANCW